MSFEADGPLCWRWIGVKVRPFISSCCPKFRYQNREWTFACREDWDDTIELYLNSYAIPSLPQRLSPFFISLMVFCGRDTSFHFTHRVEDVRRMKLLWQRKTSEVEQIFPEFSRDGLLSFRIQFTEQNPQRGLISALPFLAVQRSRLANQCAQRQMLSKTFADASVQTKLTADSLSCLNALSEDFVKMLDTESGSDLEIQCQGHTTRAHKSILCSRSPVLANMLQSDMLEGNTAMVNIRDMDTDSFRKFLNYLYTGRLDDELTHETAVLLYEAADMYGVENLSRRCSQFLVQNLTLDKACNLLAVADAHGDGDFKRLITRYILQEKIPQSGERWQDFCKSHPLLAMEVYEQYVELLNGSEGARKEQCV